MFAVICEFEAFDDIADFGGTICALVGMYEDLAEAFEAHDREVAHYGHPYVYFHVWDIDNQLPM